MILFLKEEWFFYLTKYFLNNKHIIHLSSSSFNEIDINNRNNPKHEFISYSFFADTSRKFEILRYCVGVSFSALQI